MYHMKQIGEIFKDLRKGKGISLETLASNGISSSQLSKFENGTSDLTFNKLQQALDGIGITLQEFEYAINQYDTNSVSYLIRQVEKLVREDNATALHQLLENINEKECKKITILSTIYVKSAINKVDSSYELTKKEINELSDYLFSIEEWTYFDLCLYEMAIENLSSELVENLSKELLSKAALYYNIQKNKEKINGILLNTFVKFTIKKDVNRAVYFRAILRSYLEMDNDAYSKLIFMLMNGLLTILADKEEEGKKEINTVLTTFHTLEFFKTYDKYLRICNEFTNNMVNFHI